MQHKEILNLDFNEKRLISIALIKAKGNVQIAYQLNCPDGKITFEQYKYKVYLKHNLSIEKILEQHGRRPNPKINRNRRVE